MIFKSHFSFFYIEDEDKLLTNAISLMVRQNNSKFKLNAMKNHLVL